MVLIGMPDSPYVRRVAVSLHLMGLAFEHRRVSVFRQFDEFRRINPVVKAPSFIADDGTVLMDSTLILDHVESIAPAGRGLMPTDPTRRLRSLRLIGFALAACDKSVGIVYERERRPPEKVHEPWLERMRGQANAAFEELELAVAEQGGWFGGERPDAADVITACAWRFAQLRIAGDVPAARYPALVAYSARAEALPAFSAVPPG